MQKNDTLSQAQQHLDMFIGIISKKLLLKYLCRVAIPFQKRKVNNYQGIFAITVEIQQLKGKIGGLQLYFSVQTCLTPCPTSNSGKTAPKIKTFTEFAQYCTV